VTGYAVTFARSARKELTSLPAATAGRLLARIRALADEPRPRGCKKIRGAERVWRIRVGDHRVVYRIDETLGTVDVITVRHRRDVYR
jgi:mRNA interferase RelE/StbE